jgi:hypothetical protein
MNFSNNAAQSNSRSALSATGEGVAGNAPAGVGSASPSPRPCGDLLNRGFARPSPRVRRPAHLYAACPDGGWSKRCAGRRQRLSHRPNGARTGAVGGRAGLAAVWRVLPARSPTGRYPALVSSNASLLRGVSEAIHRDCHCTELIASDAKAFLDRLDAARTPRRPRPTRPSPDKRPTRRMTRNPDPTARSTPTTEPNRLGVFRM